MNSALPKPSTSYAYTRPPPEPAPAPGGNSGSGTTARRSTAARTEEPSRAARVASSGRPVALRISATPRSSTAAMQFAGTRKGSTVASSEGRKADLMSPLRAAIVPLPAIARVSDATAVLLSKV